ncbi:MAG: hypothetical protein Q9170_004147 [Blastenia crenularia]
MEHTWLAVPKAPPKIHIPGSSATVDVRRHPHLSQARNLLATRVPGFKGLDAPTYCFLISHGDRHVLFNLGVRKDRENYAPEIVSLIEATTVIKLGSDVATILELDNSLGIHSTDIEAVIWSHNHFDHIGDMSAFSPSTELVLGPGVRDTSWPTGLQETDAGQDSMLKSDIKGRSVHEISFDGGLKLGRFDAMDHFGDRSFHLLDASGHAFGHLCAPVRTTTDPPSFVFMGADACHHAGVLRPTEYFPLPRTLPLSVGSSHSNLESDLDYSHVVECPGALFQQLTLR